jgi:hypothetical protein
MAMFHRSKTKRGVRSEMHPHRARSRRLGIELLETRRLLSNNQLDYTIWNLDALKNDYAVISQGTAIADSLAAMPQHDDSSGAGLNVEWVQVPGLFLSPGEADALAYRHWRSAMTSGTLAKEELVPLYTQWRDNAGRFSGLDSAPVFAVGIIRSDFAGLNDSDSIVSSGNSFFEMPSISVLHASFDSSAGIFTFQSSTWRDKIQSRGNSLIAGVADADVPSLASDSDGDLLTDRDSALDWNPSPPSNGISLTPVAPTSSELLDSTPTEPTASLDDSIDDLLSENVILVDQDSVDLFDSANAPPSSIESTLGLDSDNTEFVSTFDSATEGGMVSVETIVAAVAEGSLPVAPSFSQIAANGEDLGIGGELARVAVMELIDGATEPTAPALGHDTITVLAMNDAAGAVMQFVTSRGAQRTTGEWIADVEDVVNQVGATMAMLLPVDAAPIAGLAAAAESLLAAIALPGVSGPVADASQDSLNTDAAAEGARDTLFSEMGEDREGAWAAIGREHLAWLAVVPVAALLAAERRRKAEAKAAPAPVAIS